MPQRRAGSTRARAASTARPPRRDGREEDQRSTVGQRIRLPTPNSSRDSTAPTPAAARSADGLRNRHGELPRDGADDVGSRASSAMRTPIRAAADTVNAIIPASPVTASSSAQMPMTT
jgi:hypothetical protein